MTPERLAAITNRHKQGPGIAEQWPVQAYEDVRDLLADNAALREAVNVLGEYVKSDDDCVRHPKDDSLHYVRASKRLHVDTNHIASAAVRGEEQA